MVVVVVHCNCMRDMYSQEVGTASVGSYVHYSVFVTIRINTLQSAEVNNFLANELYDKDNCNECCKVLFFKSCYEANQNTGICSSKY